MLLKLFLLCCSAGVALAAPPLKVLIVTGNADLPYHHWQETTASLRAILEQAGRFEVRITEEPRGLTAEALLGYDAVVLNYHGPRWPAAAETALESSVRQGKGLLAFHQASYGPFFGQQFQDQKWREGPAGAGWAAFTKMIGASWDPAKLGHARRGIFRVEWKDPGHPVCRQLPAFFVANDELYHRLTLSPEVHVLADALSPKEMGGTGQREPLIWTHTYGRGRVLFTTLGHDAMAFYQPGMIDLFARGTEWAAAGEVTLPPLKAYAPALPERPIRLLAVTGGHTYPTAFYGMLDSLPNVFWSHATSHEEAFAQPLEAKYDVILLHDMHEQTASQTRIRLQAFVESGKGIISLHHAIVDYSDWPWWFEEVTGGKYFVQAAPGHSASSYKENVEFLVQPAAGQENHPVLRGVGPLWVFDEQYRNMWISPRVRVLMDTDAADNDRPVIYIGPHAKARVLYLQLGHSEHTMKHPGFRRLMQNAVEWASRRSE